MTAGVSRSIELRGDIIYHMTLRSRWERRQPKQPFIGDTLETEGFVHCTAEPDLLLWVANRFYSQVQDDWVVLVIDINEITSELCWETVDDHVFPHIYGPIDIGAVQTVLHFPRELDGSFRLPPLLSNDTV